jgi:hypothetical protein
MPENPKDRALIEKFGACFGRFLIPSRFIQFANACHCCETETSRHSPSLTTGTPDSANANASTATIS